MKRIIAAFVLILISIAVGITQISLVNCTADRTINNLNRIEKLVKSNKVRRAEKLAEKTAKDFESFSSTYLYCFYRHDDLSVISDSIYSLEDYLDDKRIEDFHEKCHYAKKQLLSIKEKELINLQNIL